MYFSLLIVPLFTIYIKPSIAQFVNYFCINDAQCGPGQLCLPNAAGLLFCQQVSNNMPVPGMQGQGSISCWSDDQCPGIGGKCVFAGWFGVCQYGPPAGRGNGAVSDQCYSDADCGQYLECVNNNGTLSCQIIPGKLPYKECNGTADCNFVQQCMFSSQYKTHLCLTMPQYQKGNPSGFWDTSIGNGVAPPSGAQQECTADYQCSVYDTCTGSNNQGKHFCVYNPKAQNRRCRFNADCQSGQYCERILTNIYLCKDIQKSTFMKPCTYDYECSGGERCVRIAGSFPFQQNIRSCVPVYEAPSCNTDADCPPPNICILFGRFKQCGQPVPVSVPNVSRNTSLIQEN